jgi:2-iminobutanoate/2-iminopropanoate deaminase
MELKKAIRTDRAPRALGPYNQAIEVDGTLYLSGQIGIDPETGEIVGAGAEAQTRRVIQNLEAVLAAADLTLSDVVKTTIFLVSMDDFRAVNEIYGGFFADTPPARSTVEVSRLPLGARVAIDAVARR